MVRKYLVLSVVMCMFCSILSSCRTKGHSKELDEAIQNQNVAKVKELLNQGVELEPPQQPYEINKPLAYAVQIGNFEIIKAIVEAGADIDGQVAYNDTPLIIAFQSSNNKEIDAIAKYLIEKGADVNKPNAFGMSGFIGICAANKLELAKLCIEKGANINARYQNITMEDKPYNSNALQWAVSEGYYETTKLLLENGADPYEQNPAGLDCFQIAAEKEYEKIGELLEQYKKK